MSLKTKPKIGVFAINHNTSIFLELALRSYFVSHLDQSNISITLMDNNSNDGTDSLFKYAASKGLKFLKTRFDTNVVYKDGILENNSHGELMVDFVLENSSCDYFLFLDSDICFTRPNTLQTLVRELEQAPKIWGLGAIQNDGIRDLTVKEEVGDHDRLHPCCALVRNSPLFQNIAKEIGFSGLTLYHGKKKPFWDTWELLSKIMRVNGYDYARSVEASVIHFGRMSYDFEGREARIVTRDAYLQKFVEFENNENNNSHVGTFPALPTSGLLNA